MKVNKLIGLIYFKFVDILIKKEDRACELCDHSVEGRSYTGCAVWDMWIDKPKTTLCIFYKKKEASK